MMGTEEHLDMDIAVCDREYSMILVHRSQFYFWDAVFERFDEFVTVDLHSRTILKEVRLICENTANSKSPNPYAKMLWSLDARIISN